ncbi:type II toxin-antitoxin system VapB family antitoxin [bacterium]|nr:type II toxin-antitoxin system VapB family antitoxin [bacterium]
MRTTINIPEEIIKEAEALYGTTNRSRAVEYAIKDAVRFKKLKELMALKSKITFNEKYIKTVRDVEIDEK